MNDGAVAVGYAVLLVAGARAGQVTTAGRRVAGDGRRVPAATIAALCVVGAPTLLQLTVAPWLLDQLRRDRAAIGAGQLWRLVTSLVVQDGGVAGSVFNLVILAVVGVVAERVWGTTRWVVIAVTSGVLAQVWGLLVQPVGAGNSVAVFGLAASMATLGLRRGVRAARLPAAVSLLVAVVLLLAGDIHGGAATIGAVLGVGLDSIEQRTAAHTARISLG